MGPRGGIPLVLLLLAAGASPAAADALYVLGSTGALRAIDPATAVPAPAHAVDVPGRVVTRGAGLAAQPASGVVYALAYTADACSLDPARTIYATEQDYDCGALGEADCAHAYAVRNGEPFSCTWVGPGGGCEVHGLNTCAPPPPCAGVPERVVLAGGAAAACHAYDEDPTACAAAYFVDETGAAPCYESGGACFGCDVASAAAGLCTRTCGAPDVCEDGARTLYTGRLDGCGALAGDAAVCESGFTSYQGIAFACFAGADYCTACTPGYETDGFCANTCQPPPSCEADATRTRTAGCYLANGDAAACGGLYEVSFDGPHACFAQNDFCLPCTGGFERDGLCLDACNPPVCTGEPARSLVSPGGSASCHAHDGDQAACEQSFYVGRCGEAQCYWDGATATCEPCTIDRPDLCSNACGPFAPPPPARHKPSLLTLDLASGAAATVAVADDVIEQPVALDDGSLYAIGTYTECHQGDSLFALEPASGQLSLVGGQHAPSGGAMAIRPGDPRLYRLVRDEGGLVLFVVDPATGATEIRPVSGGEPWYAPAAMTWADACNAFVVADACGDVLLVDPESDVLTQTALRIPNECDEGDWPVGLVLEGATCPILELPTTTSSSTSTTTTTSTSTSTLPSERLPGSRFSMTDDPARPRKRRLLVRARGGAIALGGGPGSSDDPMLHGGSLRLLSATFDVTYPLEDGWRVLGKPGRARGYEWKGAGPLRRVVLRAGKSLSIRGKGEALVQPLLVDPGEVRVVLRLGARQWCLEFGGTFPVRTPRKLVARDAPPPAACPPPE